MLLRMYQSKAHYSFNFLYNSKYRKQGIGIVYFRLYEYNREGEAVFATRSKLQGKQFFDCLGYPKLIVGQLRHLAGCF